MLLSRMEIGTWQIRVGRFDILRSIPKSATARADYEELSARATTSEISGRAICVPISRTSSVQSRLPTGPSTAKPAGAPRAQARRHRHSTARRS
jgi:hypothetical protein